jgi:acyl-CoA reductase-like NAD-dependent aldehyde dehydrogenase
LPFRKREHGLQRLGSAEGFAYAPTLVTGVDESFAIVSNEQFGPVLPIVRYCVHAADARVLRLISRDIGGRLHTDGAAATVTWMTS